MHQTLLLASLIALAPLPLRAQEAPAAPPPAATLALDAPIAWRSDGVEHYEHQPRRVPAEVDRAAVLDEACAAARAAGKLVLWYVPRIQEKQLGGRQMYRAPVLDVYMRQVLFCDPEVQELLQHAFVPLRCTLDQALSDRFGLSPLAFVEPAVVFLDGDGRVVHLVEHIRTFHAPWFAALLTRVLAKHPVAPAADDVDGLRRVGRWQDALALALRKDHKVAADWLGIARLQRLLRRYDEALQSVARADLDGKNGDAACEAGLVHSLAGRLLAAQPLLERASRQKCARAAEAGYWHALNQLRLGDEASAMRRFQLVAQRHPDDLFGRRARANTTLAADDRPLGAAFTGFESLAPLPDAAFEGLPRDTMWPGALRDPAAMARAGVEFLLAQQRDDGGFTDARYAYWPNSEITPNVWVAITALCCTALFEQRAAAPHLQQRIELALQRGEAFLLDPKHLNRGVNEDCYSDAYRLLFFARRATAADPASEERRQLVDRMNQIVAAATARQGKSGFWAHEYENAFATGAVVQELLVAKAAGAEVPVESLDRAASALLSARFDNGTFVYGGSRGDRKPTSPKDSSGRMPVCEAGLLQLGRSDLPRLRAALDTFWQFLQNLDGVRRNDFHSDGELGGFFFFHAVFHASEAVRLLPPDEQPVHWQRFVTLLQRIPEIDGSWIDSHELGRSYGTAMALLTLANAVARQD